MTAQSERIVAYVRPSLREQITPGRRGIRADTAGLVTCSAHGRARTTAEQASDDSLLS